MIHPRNERGFGALIASDTFIHHLGPDMVACNNISCEGEALFTGDSETCECGTVHYCSHSCKEIDSGHKCPERDPGLSLNEGDDIVLLFHGPGEVGIQGIRGVFDGVKDGKKFVRGRIGKVGDTVPSFDENDNFTGTYSGGLTTVKKNGTIFAMPHGKGVLYVSPISWYTGTFENGRAQTGRVNTHNGIHLHVNFSDDLQVTGMVRYERNGVSFIGGVHETEIDFSYKAKSNHESWKHTIDATCMKFDGTGSEGVPIVISKESLGNSKVIKTEKIEKIIFKTCVHWEGDGEFDINGPFMVSFSSCSTCHIHGKWNIASVCEVFDMEDIVRMVDEMDIDCNCSCTKKKNRHNIQEDVVFSKPTPVKIPVVKGDGKKGKRTGKKIISSKGGGVRGISSRDMLKTMSTDDRSLPELLGDGGWELKRQKNHLVYQRLVDDVRQNYVCSKTPSCSRWEKNAIRSIKNAERNQ